MRGDEGLGGDHNGRPSLICYAARSMTLGTSRRSTLGLSRGAQGEAMGARIKIDFVSDVSCPWCVIGLRSLQAALARLGDAVSAEVHFQPFERNPQMPPEGQDLLEHIAEKYGSSADQIARSREMIRARGAELGFLFDMRKRGRVYNTFDAHRLLHWAGIEGGDRQKALKEALFTAYFTDGRNPGDHEVLVDLAERVGLDGDRARRILSSD